MMRDAWKKWSSCAVAALLIGCGATSVSRPVAAAPALSAAAVAQATMETPTVAGVLLRGNPLHDPTARKIAVFLPAGYTTLPPLPVVYYLPGFGGSSDGAIHDATSWEAVTQRAADAGHPVVIVVVDGRTRWACSQYINSPGQGNYGDYIAREVVSYVEAHYRVARGPENRVIAGHSSGGFGALRLGCSYPNVFGHVIALSPDSDFNVTHLPLTQGDDVRRYPLDKVRALAPVTGGPLYIMALSAAYAPVGNSHPGQVEWLYDDQHRFRPEIWKRWLANDPLEIAERDRKAFRRCKGVYLDGAAHDEFKANIGAGKIASVLLARGVHCTFNEPPGGHGDHVLDRLLHGIDWSLTDDEPRTR